MPNNNMKFALVTLYVKDMEKTLNFYYKVLGLPIIGRHSVGEGKELIFLGEEDKPCIELVPTDEETSYEGFSIGFDVSNLKETKKALAQHGYTIDKEMKAGDSGVICFFTGPNGELIELMSH